MSRYTNDMHSPTNRQSSVDDRRRGNPHYPQMYESADHNGGQVSPTRSTGRAVEVPISQPGQHQQRMVPVGQTRPPVANNAPVGRGTGSNASRPPSYSGPASEERLDVKSDAANQRQQERRRGYRRADEPAEEWEQNSANPQPNARPGAIQTSSYGPSSAPNQSLPASRDRANPTPQNRRQDSQAQKPASPTKPKDSLSPGTTIPRLNSPSVMSSVLQPLDKKIQEYDSQMNEAQTQMARFDAEMAALQERRREAEHRYMAAKTKHDDYRRQYQGVERAMRGEPEVFSRLSFDDAESERPSTQQTLAAQPQANSPRANSSRTESWSSLKKSKNDSRFRLSKLFGSS